VRSEGARNFHRLENHSGTDCLTKAAKCHELQPPNFIFKVPDKNIFGKKDA
jgi:hypothetical protein